MTSETAISRWLHTEMPRRGYPLQGHRAGGISRLAEDAGIPQATMSRIVNGRAEPSVESLRKLAHLWKIPLGELLVHAGLADPSDLHVYITHPDSDHVDSLASIPAHIKLDDLEPWERGIWLIPDLTDKEKKSMILLVRLRRGTVDDEGLLHLYHALGQIVERRLGSDNPRRRAM